MRITLSNKLPEYPTFVEGIRRAPDRGYTLTPEKTVVALKNALRYIPEELHEQLAPEFLEELCDFSFLSEKTHTSFFDFLLALARQGFDFGHQGFYSFFHIFIVISLFQLYRNLTAEEGRA